MRCRPAILLFALPAAAAAGWALLAPARGDANQMLVQAVYRGDGRGVEWLLRGGADPNAPDADGRPVLVVAVRRHEEAAFRALVGGGADVRSARGGAWPPLVEAVHEQEPEMIDLLVARGADVDGGELRGWPLFLAAVHDDARTMKLLLDRGADANARCTGSVTYDGPFGQQDAAALIFESGPPGLSLAPDDFDGQTPLHVAAFAPRARVDIARLLLDHGADVNARDAKGWTPLDLAVTLGRRELADYLAARGGRPGRRRELPALVPPPTPSP